MRGAQNTRQQNGVVGSTDTAWKRKISLLRLSKGKPFFFYACVIPFSRYGYLGVSANLIVFFLFIYLFILKLNFIHLFIYSFPTNSWKMEVIFSIIIRVRIFSEKNDLLKIYFLIIVIFLDYKYIKTLLNSNKIRSENFRPVCGIKLEIIG